MNLMDSANRVKYVLKIDNKVIFENSSLSVVENYKSTLTEDQKSKADIIPVTNDGKQVLLG